MRYRLLMAWCCLTLMACGKAESPSAETLTPLASAEKTAAAKGRIYFFGDLYGSPGINIFSVDFARNVRQHTADRGSRDIDIALDQQGNMVFTSNRVIDREARAHQQPPTRRAGRPQIFNAFYLPRDQTELERQALAQPITHTQDQEVHVNISSDGRWISLVRSQQREDSPNQRIESLVLIDKSAPLANAHPDDALVAPSHATAETQYATQIIASSDLIIRTDWSTDNRKLLFATHEYRNDGEDRAKLAVFDTQTRQTSVLLENPVGPAQIDAPQWSPDGNWVSFVSHPLDGSGSRQLYLLDLHNQTLIKASAVGHQVQVPVSWSNDSRQVVYGALIDYSETWSDELRTKLFAGAGHLFLTNTRGETRQLTNGDKALHTRPVFSPDNRQIAYMYADELPGRTAELRVMDLAGETVATLHDRVAGTGYLIWR